ncbi:hypothetical protein QBC41DRAFT_308131 [Cercophora samala]|uniref:DUF6594 domain-containing protein n=1 Tax=Cercophora samala TaxID=330535 RepID=A0AA40D3A5_9PEZI|nr:hypothetical protein QBC41DRAFT_308131 [Cercophora samala]
MHDSPLPPGYPRLAAFMRGSQNEVAILKRFDHANVLALLSLQAEVVELEQEYRDQCLLDHQDDSTRRFSESLKLSRHSKSPQYEKLMELREKLEEYNRFIIQVHQMNSIPSPQPSQLSALKDWLRDFKGGNSFLQSNEAFTWADPDPSSYLCLSAPVKETDPFTTFITEKILGAYHHFLGHRLGTGEVVDTETGHTSYSSSRISQASSLITTVLASILPVLTILVLNTLESTNARIAVTAAFTALFALVIAVFSDAKRIEIFAATATFAAVEVVFIGSALTGTSQG